MSKIKDSGKRQQFDSGMQRDVCDDKTDYTLVRDGPMYVRWAEHMTAGAKKYDARNWMKASGSEELERFKQSAVRHFEQWLAGETDEDHAAAVFFNINGVEYVLEKMRFEQAMAEALYGEMRPEHPRFEHDPPGTIYEVDPNVKPWHIIKGCGS